jgi:hypothetical protein
MRAREKHHLEAENHLDVSRYANKQQAAIRMSLRPNGYDLDSRASRRAPKWAHVLEAH